MFKLRLPVFIFCGYISTTPAFAQTGQPSPGHPDTIVITASRSPLAKANIGSSITIISREQIERRQARYVTDLLRAVPGFSVSQSGTTGSQTQVRVRGAEANQVLVLIDGVRANDPAVGDEFRWELLSTGNIERIEIVRGPQSSLWGSDAVAAVVQIITRNGGKTPALGGYAESGSYSTLNAGLQGTAGGDRWSLGFGLEKLDTDGTNISRSGGERDDSSLTTISLSGRFQPVDALALDLGMRRVDSYSQFDPVDFFTTGLPTDGDRATDSRQTYLYGDTTLATRGGRLVHHLAARYLDTTNRNLADGAQNSSTGSERMTTTWQSDLQLGENLLSLGLERERTQFSQRGEIGFGDPNQDQETTVNSVFTDIQGRSIDRLTWLLSARYDNYSDFENALTGRLSLAWRLTDATRIRASMGTGQKTPTFTERFGFFPGQFIGNPRLKPEKSTSFEIGIDQSMLNDTLDVQLTLYNQDLEDEINGFVFDPDTFMFTAQNMSDSSSRKGVELSATLEWTENLELGAAYTFTDAVQPDDQGNDIREFRRPRHAGSLSANYRLLAERANITLTADYGGTQTDIFFPPFPAPSEIVPLDSYWLVDLTAGYAVNRNINVYARLTNLLDEDYEQVYGYRTPGRSGYFGVRLKFGQ